MSTLPSGISDHFCTNVQFFKVFVQPKRYSFYISSCSFCHSWRRIRDTKVHVLSHWNSGRFIILNHGYARAIQYYILNPLKNEDIILICKIRNFFSTRPNNWDVEFIFAWYNFHDFWVLAQNYIKTNTNKNDFIVSYISLVFPSYFHEKQT